MTTQRSMVVVLAFLVSVGAAVAQDRAAPSPEQQAMMDAWMKAMTPGEPHALLAEMAGEFELTVKSYSEPGAEPMVSKATAKRTMIMGGRYLEETVHGSFMGQPFEGRGLTGFDNVTGLWWGMWVDNMSTGLMTSTGEWDQDAGQGTFWGEATDPATGEPMKVRTDMKRLSGGNELMESYMVTPEGEFKSMEILYERK